MTGKCARSPGAPVSPGQAQVEQLLYGQRFGEEVLAGRQAALWLREKTLTLEHGGELLSHYAVEFSTDTTKPRSVARPVLFGSAIPPSHPSSSG